MPAVIAIEFVCSVMWQPYRKVIRESCSQALHILDRFHIVDKMNHGVRDILPFNLKTVRAYRRNEQFRELREYDSPTWAGKFLDLWCRRVMRSRTEPMNNIARSLREHILN